MYISQVDKVQKVLSKYLPRLSTEALNTITIENDEMCHGLDESLKLKDHLALVLDIHHHWIRNEEYIQPEDDRVKEVIDSWRGVRPAMHYSYSRDEHLPATDDTHTNMHDIVGLLEQGHKKQKLRAHSDYFPNEKANAWALSFWSQFDIQCEAKAKNLASEQLWQPSNEYKVMSTQPNFGKLNVFSETIQTQWMALFNENNIDIIKQLSILELGTGLGSSAFWITNNLCHHVNSLLVTVDNFKNIEHKNKLLSSKNVRLSVTST